MTSRTIRDSPILTAAFLAMCAVIPFGRALNAGFLNWDDPFLILDNPAVRTLGWSSIVSWFTTFPVNHYHPFLLFTFAVEHAAAGFDPMAFHLTNLLLHGVNTVLVFVLLRSILQDRLVIILAVLFFALHPLRTEAVVWISARKDLLSTGFILASVLFFMHYRRTDSALSYAASLGGAILASLSKALAVVLPFLLLALPLVMGAERSRKGGPRSLVPFFFIALVTGIVAIVAQYSTGTTAYDPSHSFLRAITLPFWNVVFYAWKTIIPAQLSAVYPFPENGGPDLLLPSVISLVVISIVAITLIIVRPSRVVLFGTAWTLISLAPVLQILPAGRAFAADRFTYLPAVGLAVIIGALLAKAVTARKGAYRPLVRRAGIIVLAVLGTLSYVRTEVWERSVTLWTNVLEAYPEYAEGYVYLGSALATEEGDMPLAISAFSESIRLDDRNPAAFSNRAIAMYQNESDDAEQIISDLTTAIALAPGDIEQQVLLAEMYEHFGQVQRAFDVCSALLDAYPSLHRVRLLRIRCAYQLGRTEIVDDDIRVLGEAGISVSIEKQ